MLIILTILTALALGIIISRTAWTYHRDKLATQHARTSTALHAARILANHIEQLAATRDSAIYARDYYRAALTDIINNTDENDPANQIAQRFLRTNESTH